MAKMKLFSKKVIVPAASGLGVGGAVFLLGFPLVGLGAGAATAYGVSKARRRR